LPLLVAATYSLRGAGDSSGLLLLYCWRVSGGRSGARPDRHGPRISPAVRFTGVSFSYNVAYAVFGGMTPPLVSVSTSIGPARHTMSQSFSYSFVAIFAAPTAQDWRKIVNPAGRR
jgi:hypothetical protein